jgi:DNA-binding XRE family transcriptional regulator
VKLTDEIIQKIEEYLGLGYTWTHIAKLIGVDRRTLYRWQKESKEAKRGKKKELRLAIERATLKINIACRKTIAEQVSSPRRRTTIIKKRIDKGGETIIERTERTTELPPDANLALKWLEKTDPQFLRRVISPSVRAGDKNELSKHRDTGRSGSGDSTRQRTIDELDNAFRDDTDDEKQGEAG